jgi:hypothetical protein
LFIGRGEDVFRGGMEIAEEVQQTAEDRSRSLTVELLVDDRL